MWQHTQDDGNIVIIDTPRTIVHGDVQHPADILTKWSVEELAAIGVEAIAVHSATPAAEEPIVAETPPVVAEPRPTATSAPPVVVDWHSPEARLAILRAIEEANEAATYYDGADASQFPLLAKRAAQSGLTLLKARSAYLDEVAAVKATT